MLSGNYAKGAFLSIFCIFEHPLLFLTRKEK